ncbi:NAD(P)-binding protein [Suillus hirtellus]|nr:NAD(P)-binding protein [Suillus hirtellus]
MLHETEAKFSHSSQFPAQSASPLGKLGVEAALEAAADPSITPKPKIFDEFALTDRVGLVSGGNRGLGLEMALACCEAGARVVYCFDLPEKPSDEWIASRDYTVTDQQALWRKTEEIGDKEGRMDFCIAAAGILRSPIDCLEYPAEEYREVLDVNASGVLFTAQAAGRQMSIILIASMSGSVTNKGHTWVSYNTSKSAVLQMARSMACELGEKKIRVNSLSPGYMYTNISGQRTAQEPHLLDVWSNMNPMGRLGRSNELRGVHSIARSHPLMWLASDASTFCTGSDIVVSGGLHSW